MLKNWLSRNKLYVIGALLGAIGGYWYYASIGCSTGTCPITSRPVNSTLYGSMMGALLMGMFKPTGNTDRQQPGESNKS